VLVHIAGVDPAERRSGYPRREETQKGPGLVHIDLHFRSCLSFIVSVQLSADERISAVTRAAFLLACVAFVRVSDTLSYSWPHVLYS
jgi:hypothetical protein